MLKLYYGRENVDKDRFLFDEIRRAMEQDGIDGQGQAGRGGKLLLVVPDQFTLQAEQNAFEQLDLAGMMDLEILSQTRLGFRILNEAGGIARLHIDKYGRHMVIARIVRELEQELTAYQGVKNYSGFIEMANSFITEMKQNGVEADRMEDILAAVPEEALLRRKLADIGKIFSRYEERLAGKYLDTEDYTALFTSKIAESQLIADSRIWIYGFDSFTKKSLDMLRALMLRAKEVAVIMTGDDAEGFRDFFQITDRMTACLAAIAGEAGVPWEKRAIPEDYQICRDAAPELAHLERELCTYIPRPYVPPTDEPRPDAQWDGVQPTGTGGRVRLCRAANLYSEVETAAARITELVRDHGLRCHEIAVICNDLSGYGSVIKRIFALYDLPVFLDEKQGVLHNPAAVFLDALLCIPTKGWRTQDIFRMLKTGLFPMNADQYQELENYAVKYRIQGSRWKKEFTYGVGEYGEDGLRGLDALRSGLSLTLSIFEKQFKGAGSVREKSEVLYHMLAETLQVPARLGELAERLTDQGEFLAAEETAQVWGIMIKLLDQMVELVGDEKISAADYADMLKAGLEAVEVGLLPPTMDQIIVGTMQRTRRGKIRALFVLGAGDGLLPAETSGEELLSDMEKSYLEQQGIVLCRNDDYRTGEEQLAIYKNLSRTEEFLWVSYSVTNPDGSERKPSAVVDKLRRMFPQVPLEQDIINCGEQMAQIQTGRGALSHMGEAFHEVMWKGEEKLPVEWKITCQVLNEQSHAAECAADDADGTEADAAAARLKQEYAVLRRGLLFSNGVQKLDEKLVGQLYRQEGMEDFIFSPSRMERFGKCPFSHFVQYGLSPRERRIFEVAGRETGDIYHQCLMELSEQLTVPGIDVTDSASPWMQISREECEQKIADLIEKISGEYREGVLRQGAPEEYRAERMKKTAAEAAWVMISHVRAGKIRKIYFEAGFGDGRGKPFPAVRMTVGGKRVRIEGKIDRVDLLAPGDPGTAPYVKIVDYKSGNEHFDMQEAREGVRLQLMLYLEGAMGGVENGRPAGVFYFGLPDPLVNASGLSKESLEEKVAAQVRREFRMDGVMVDDPAVVAGIDGEFEGYSDIAPLRRGRNGVSGTGLDKFLSPQDFEQFRGEVADTVAKLAAALVSGETAISPKKMKKQTACQYCSFKGICFFDLAFEGCQYR